MTKNLEVFYDKEGDILEITIGAPSPCIFDEIEDDLFEAHDEKTDELKGYKILNFSKRAVMENIKLKLPAKVNITA